MKKYSKIAYIIIVLLIIAFSFIVYNKIKEKQSDKDIKVKTLSEVKHLESRLVEFFNQMNNINYENYKISSNEIKEEKQEESQKSKKSDSSSGGEEKSEGKSGSSEESSNSGSESSQGSNSSSSQENKKYQLEKTGILSGNLEPNWQVVKSEVEQVYSSLYSTNLDLYEIVKNQDEVLNFNQEYDNLTKAVKEENKEETLTELSLLYDYMPSFIEKCSNDEKEKILIRTKNYIFKAYGMLDQEEWATISGNISKAAEEFIKIVTDIKNNENKNQFSINKVYVIINELQNAVILKDKEVFLIKYKNLLEEIEKI